MLRLCHARATACAVGPTSGLVDRSRSGGVADHRRHRLHCVGWRVSVHGRAVRLWEDNVADVPCRTGTRERRHIGFLGAPLVGPAPGISVVFQDYSRSLLPWKNNLDNVMFGMRRVADASRREKRERARELPVILGLEGFECHYPWQVSGGMQQRSPVPWPPARPVVVGRAARRRRCADPRRIARSASRSRGPLPPDVLA